MRKYIRPSPALPYCMWAGPGSKGGVPSGVVAVRVNQLEYYPTSVLLKVIYCVIAIITDVSTIVIVNCVFSFLQ